MLITDLGVKFTVSILCIKCASTIQVTNAKYANDSFIADDSFAAGSSLCLKVIGATAGKPPGLKITLRNHDNHYHY